MKSFSGDIGKKCRSAVPASSRLTAQTDGKGIHAICTPSCSVRAPDSMEQSNGSASEGWNLVHGRPQTFVPMGSPHDGETSNAGGLELNAKLIPYPSTGWITTTQRAGAWFIEPLSDAGFVATNPVTTRGLQVVGAQVDGAAAISPGPAAQVRSCVLECTRTSAMQARCPPACVRNSSRPGWRMCM